MTPFTAVLLGGPKDGDLLALRDWTLVAAEAELDYAHLDSRHPATVDLKKSLYRRETLAFFKTPIAVMVHDSLVGNERKMLEVAARHLLSDKAKGAVVR